MKYCECCCKIRCAVCVRSNFCAVPNCELENCAECDDENHYNVKYCGECGIAFCGFDLIFQVNAYPDEYCTDCKSRAALNLTDENKDFGKSVLDLEDKYSVKGPDCWSSAGDNFSQALDARKELLQRCRSVGLLLSTKQKQFERFDKFLASNSYFET